jgi:hypothetical protein
MPEKMKHNKLIMPLDSVRNSDQSIVGTKAVGLARLKRLGMPVPDAFCVAANAYETHINSLSLKVVIGNATKIIKTGQTIQVDGDRGVVRILE